MEKAGIATGLFLLNISKFDDVGCGGQRRRAEFRHPPGPLAGQISSHIAGDRVRGEIALPQP
ncbi:MAG TPA: hypothetical protein PKE66_15130, partial [Pyrinomonadaceae bacterium]|nr:hypothetical protein [Pyrinomonadaceae bacterium]